MSETIIKLSNCDKSVLIDSDIVERLKGKTVWLGYAGYPEVAIPRKGRRSTRIHRLVLNPQSGKFVDHINGDKPDNRRVNLRIVTPSQNLYNRHVVRNSTGYFGVFNQKSSFRIEIQKERKRFVSCSWRSCHIAAIFGNGIRQMLHGEYASLNFKNTIERSSLRSFIDKTAGRFFRVIFSKRSNGRQREMTCRTGVAKYIKGKGMNYNPEDENLYVVFDVNKGEYRIIPLDRVICLSFNGKKYKVA